jgi:UDP-N-acetylmuramate dehydrogenase
MNAGGHGSDTSQTLSGCRWLDLRTGEVANLTGEALAFGYRCSAVEAHHVVVSADYRLVAGDGKTSEATIREIIHWRREHQPGGQNAGSVFTNPPGEPPADSAGWLVEASGLKGYRRGTAMVSEKHANFIQADPGGSADDVVALMRDVQEQVASRLGVTLKAEVKLVGFEETSTRGLTRERGL